MKKKRSGLISDVLRRVPLTGVSDLRSSVDIRRVLLANVENLRDGALDIFAVEVSRMLSRLDFQKIVDNVIQGYTIKLEAKIDLIPKGRKAKPGKGKR